MKKTEANGLSDPPLNLQTSDLQASSAAGWTEAQIQLLKEQFAPRLSEGELRLFKYVCEKSGLDPFMRQIHAVKRWDPKKKRESITFQTGIDGYRVIAERSREYAGSDKPVFVYHKRKPADKIDERDPRALKVNLQSATVTVYRLVQGQRMGYTATAYWDEYAQHTSQGGLHDFWRRMPRGQLAKCAEALALRKAFPADLSGIYTFEEMQQASNLADVPNRSSVTMEPDDSAGSEEQKQSFQHGKSSRSIKDMVLLYSKDQIIDEIKNLEEKLFGPGNGINPALMKGRQTYGGNTDISKATLPGLKNYLIYLKAASPNRRSSSKGLRGM